MKPSHRFLPLVVAILLVAGCSSSSNTVSSVDPATDFSRYGTYNFVSVPGTDGQQYQSLETGYLKAAVSRELESRGFRQTDQADMLVNFSLETQEKVRSRSVPTTSYGVGYDPFYDAYYDGWATTHQTRIDQYTEGYLDIDVIDPGERKVIWQGTTKGRLTKKDFENPRATLNEAVAEIFTQFPVPAPAAP